MIPKVIHYCWFGHSPLPDLAKKCIESWKKYLPNYEIKEWNEENFDVNMIRYTAKAYEMKKYAFVSDYARFWILYRYGGLYFDTDVEVIRPIDDIIEKGPFMGCETNAGEGATKISVAPGLGLGVSPGLSLYSDILHFYNELKFEEEILYGKTVVYYTTSLLQQKGLKDIDTIQYVEGVYVYPKDFFCPINIVTKHLNITSNTRTIHHYMASWMEKTVWIRIKESIQSYLPESILVIWSKIKQGKLMCCL